MRKLAMLATALVCLGYAVPSFAQGNSGPQPGLPPGANIDAPNAGQPPPTGRVTTTTGVARPMTMAPTTMAAPAAEPSHYSRSRRARRRAIRHYRRTHHVAPATAPEAPANQ